MVGRERREQQAASRKRGETGSIARLESAEEPERRLSLSTRIAQLYEEQLEDLEGAFTWYSRVFLENPVDDAIRDQILRLAGILDRWTEVAEVLAQVRSGEPATVESRAALRMAGTYTIRECADVVDLAYKIVGSTGIYQNQTIQRRFQDMHVITQHVQAREAHYNLLGRYLISGDYEFGPMS